MQGELTNAELTKLVQQLSEKLLTLEQRALSTNEVEFDTGDVSWMLTSSAFVLMMTIPGLALFYGGMSKTKNVLTTVMQSFSIACVITVVWMFCGYSLAFAPRHEVNNTSNWFIGDFSLFWLQEFQLGSSHQLAPNIPESVFCLFEMTFAIITPALVCGSFADRVKYGSCMLFVTVWHLLVYCPIAHWVWHPDGFLFKKDILDYAGGFPIEIASGVSGLVATMVIGNGAKFGEEIHNPHSILYTVTGACLLWVGWFGFNGGSAFASNSRAAMSLFATQISTATAALSWMITELWFRKQPSVLGTINGAVAGLVSITPACGYVDNTGAFFIGLIAGPLCFFGANLKHRLGYDDALDAFGIHGVGGIVGTLCTGLFATSAICGSNGVFYDDSESGGEGWRQFGVQLLGVVTCTAYSAAVTGLITLVIDRTVGFRVSVEFEEKGLDGGIHGETVELKSAPLALVTHKAVRRVSMLLGGSLDGSKHSSNGSCHNAIHHHNKDMEMPPDSKDASVSNRS